MSTLASTIIANMKPFADVRSTDTDQDTELLRCVNYGARKLWGMREWRWKIGTWQFTTEADVSTYTLNANGTSKLAHGSIFWMRHLDERQLFLTKVDVARIIQVDAAMQQKGDPLRYAELGLDSSVSYQPQVLIHPIPGGSYPLEYSGRRTFTELASGDSTAVPGDFDIIIEQFALAAFFAKDEEPSKAGYWNNEAATLLAPLILRDASPSGMRTAPFGQGTNIQRLDASRRGRLLTLGTGPATSLNS